MPSIAAKRTRSDIHLQPPQGDMQMASLLEKPCTRAGKLPDTPGYPLYPGVSRSIQESDVCCYLDQDITGTILGGQLT